MKKIIIIISSFVLLTSSLLALYSFQKNTKEMYTFTNENYDDLWKAVDSLNNLGQPRSALKKVNVIYDLAKKEENPSQLVKSLIYIGKYETTLEEDGLVKTIYKMEQEAKAATFPSKQILQSALAEMYQRYLNNNIWTIRDRTITDESFKQDDIRTWDMERLVKATMHYYNASIEDIRTRKVDIEDFSAITTSQRFTKKLRPTLYDLLIHRAIDYFTNEQTYLTQPANQFVMNDEDMFKPATDFTGLRFRTEDTLSNKWNTILLLQQAMDFHRKEKNTTALIDVDLKRLDFIKNNSVLQDKDELYLNALEHLKEKYKNNPAVTEITSKVAAHYYNQGLKYNPAADAYKWDLKKAYDLCESAIEKFPDSYGVSACKALQNNILQKSIGLTIEKVNDAESPILALVTYKNIKKVYVKVIKVSEAQIKTLSRRNTEEYIRELNKLSITISKIVELPNDGDYQTHSVEIGIDKLPYGNYILVASDDANFTNQKHGLGYTQFHVSNIAFIEQQMGNNTNTYYVVDRISGKPLRGVTTEFYEQSYNRLKKVYEFKKKGKQTTDSEGKFQLKFKRNYENIYVKYIKGKDTLFIQNPSSNRVYNYKGKKQKTTTFFLDRAIYRPGQTVYFKGLALAFDKNRMPTILPNEKVIVTFFDANYQKVEEKSFTTNEYGTFNGTFIAPTGGLNGQMHLQSSIAGQKYFRVEEYKRPKFDVTFNPIKESYRLEDKVKVKGVAKAFAGNNIDGAKVTYRVVRKVRFPYWRSWYWGWYNPYERPDMEITNGETVTNDLGEFEIEFKAIPDKTVPKDRMPQFDYQVIADVVDITGETHSSQAYVSVGYIAMQANIVVAEQINREKAQNFAITTKNLNGEYEAAKGKVVIEKLKTPEQVYKTRYWSKPDLNILSQSDFKKDFPDFAYADEDDYQKWAVQSKVLDINFDTEISKEVTISEKAKKWTSGKYKVTFKTADKYGMEIEQIKYFTLYDLDAKQPPLNVAAWYVNEKTTLEPGETAKFAYGTTDKKINVLYEIEHDGKLVESKWVNIKSIKGFDLPIVEKYRGNVYYKLTHIKNNRVHTTSETIYVPWTNKELNFEYATFRNKLLPGEKEEWQIKISGTQKDKIAGEMLATMYDASLDKFAVNSWNLSPYPSNYQYIKTSAQSNFQSISLSAYGRDWQPNYYNNQYRQYANLNWFGFDFYGYRGARLLYSTNESVAVGRASRSKKSRSSAPSAPAPAMYKTETNDLAVFEEAETIAVTNDPVGLVDKEISAADVTEMKEDFGDVKVRTNLNETVFFFPELKTDEEGNVIVKFTMNEALTKWKFLGMAHTKDLKLGFTQNEVVTQKDLMVVPNAPRFFRENDIIHFTAKVSNLSESNLTGTAVLQLFDALTMQPIDDLLENNKAQIAFDVKKGLSTPLSWKLKIPDGSVSAVTYRVIAKAGDYSDGEESALPVLTNRMMITETQPLALRGEQTKDFTFTAMKKASESTTLKHHEMTLEFTSNPAWYAVQSLPYLMEYPYECTEQMFNRFYANSLATMVANSSPKIKQVFDKWRDLQPEALASNLSKNEELKYAILEETPWVLNAQSEEIQKKNIALLFDLNKMSREMDKTMGKLKARQKGNGGFAWFPGGRDSWYITQYLLEGMGHLDHLGVNKKATGLAKIEKMEPVVGKAIEYVDGKMLENYRKLEKLVKEGKAKWEDDHLGYMEMHYLYTRSFYLGTSMDDANKKVLDYYLGQAKKYWNKKSQYMKGMLALSLHRYGETEVPGLIVKSLKEYALNDDEMGMYWKYGNGYRWYQLPIETHALMIEVFDEVAQDAQAVDDLKVWLLKNKQTTHWKTTKATSAAVYALLLRGDNWLMEDKDVQISLGGKALDLSKVEKEAGTGYFKKKWNADEITADMANIKVVNPNKNPAWGAMYWQYFEDLDKIKTFEDTPLKLKKQLFKEVNSPTGPVLKPISEGAKLEPGDKIIVRIELRADRAMEYVHMKDARASGFEPINVMSQYKWQGGLGYYESTRDAATNFFISYLPKGTYVFEYPLRANHKGDFSNGVTTIQCMYAPEFTSHSEGIRVTVE